MKTNILVLCLIVCLISIVILGHRLHIVSDAMISMHKIIDNMVLGSLSLLCSNLGNDTSLMRDSEFEAHKADNKKHIHLAINLFPLTSYSDNREMSDILLLLNQIIHFDILDLTTEHGLVEDLMYYCHNMESTDIANRILSQLEDAIQQNTDE
jgi:hypothetical protein